ncbi:Uncharacterized protein HZ326_27712 [Fusarium oxysporum f. sp. albedinis]|nr:Uncharacterized protein HZ326_27712 [Fusarium oxysporum f. sp. albedinis]
MGRMLIHLMAISCVEKNRPTVISCWNIAVGCTALSIWVKRETAAYFHPSQIRNYRSRLSGPLQSPLSYVVWGPEPVHSILSVWIGPPRSYPGVDPPVVDYARSIS